MAHPPQKSKREKKKKQRKRFLDNWFPWIFLRSLVDEPLIWLLPNEDLGWLSSLTKQIITEVQTTPWSSNNSTCLVKGPTLRKLSFRHDLYGICINSIYRIAFQEAIKFVDLVEADECGLHISMIKSTLLQHIKPEEQKTIELWLLWDHHQAFLSVSLCRPQEAALSSVYYS